jgi:CRISPR-associated protein Csb1
VSIRYAKQTTVLSLAALRRLSFPQDGVRASANADPAARIVLAALALAAVAYQREEGFDLRSRCLLVPVEPPAFELVPGDGSSPVRRSLGVKDAQRIFEQAVKGARAAGLPWTEEELVLTPSERLRNLVQRSLEVGMPLGGGDMVSPEEE